LELRLTSSIRLRSIERDSVGFLAYKYTADRYNVRMTADEKAIDVSKRRVSQKFN